MKERPILFNGEMVRAILDGRKTQTRMPFKFRETNQPPSKPELFNPKHVTQPPPLGTVGDRLWVRETWMDCDIPEAMVGANQVIRGPKSERVENWLRAAWHKGSPDPGGWPARRGWRPSVHMPRWASRIDLEITRVWVERVQDITEEDAKAEGIVESEIGRVASRLLANYKMQTRAPVVLQFADLWQSIYGTWGANPWVWAYEFRRIKP